MRGWMRNEISVRYGDVDDCIEKYVRLESGLGLRHIGWVNALMYRFLRDMYSKAGYSA